jgi:hypothetical protein
MLTCQLAEESETAWAKLISSTAGTVHSPLGADASKTFTGVNPTVFGSGVESDLRFVVNSWFITFRQLGILPSWLIWQNIDPTKLFPYRENRVWTKIRIPGNSSAIRLIVTEQQPSSPRRLVSFAVTIRFPCLQSTLRSPLNDKMNRRRGERIQPKD